MFTVVARTLHVLLVQRPSDPHEPFPGKWALPGGFVDTELDRDLEACARRKLMEKTGVGAPYLEQVASFGGASRRQSERKPGAITTGRCGVEASTRVCSPRDRAVWVPAFAGTTTVFFTPAFP